VFEKGIGRFKKAAVLNYAHKLLLEIPDKTGQAVPEAIFWLVSAKRRYFTGQAIKPNFKYFGI
jgi:hypothetical protein